MCKSYLMSMEIFYGYGYAYGKSFMVICFFFCVVGHEFLFFCLCRTWKIFFEHCKIFARHGILVGKKNFWAWKIFVDTENLFSLDMGFWLEKFFWDMRFFVGKIFFRHGKKKFVRHGILVGYWKKILGHGKLFWTWDFGWKYCGHLNDWLNSILQNLKSQGSLQCWKAYGRYCLQILRTSLMKRASKIFFQTLLNHDTQEYKDLLSLLALSKCFWDITCTFYFPGIGEVMLIPYDFSTITSLRLGGEKNQSQWFPYFKRD